MSELPKGWTTTLLKEVTLTRKGKKPQQLNATTEVGFVPYLDIRAIETNEIRQFADVASSRIATKNDVLMVWDGARSGWVGFGKEGAIGSTIMALESLCGEPLYLYHFLKSSFEQINANTRGTGIPHVDPDIFNNLSVPVAPLNEQRRIVSKLETLLGKVDASQQRLAKLPRLLKRFRQAVLAAACSGRLTADWREAGLDDGLGDNEIPKSWKAFPFKEVIESSFYGPRFSADSYSNTGIPTIRTTDIRFDGSIVLTDAPCISVSEQELEKYGLKQDDLLITRTGATIGKCALYDSSIGLAIPSAYLIRFRLKRDFIHPRYILRFLMSPVGQELLLGGSTAVAQPNVNATTISEFILPLPPLAEQQEIVRRVEAFFRLADQLEARYHKAKAHVDKLTQSLLAKAFRGELVPQDPKDEPASVLLERIRAERAAQSKDAAKTAKRAAKPRD